MNSRSNRSRRAFRFESLEIRNAPSHFSGLAHAAMAVHSVHASAHVRHFTDSQATDKTHPLDKSGVEKSADAGVETSGNDQSGIDTNPKDQSGVDPSGQR